MSMSALLVVASLCMPPPKAQVVPVYHLELIGHPALFITEYPNLSESLKLQLGFIRIEVGLNGVFGAMESMAALARQITKEALLRHAQRECVSVG